MTKNYVILLVQSQQNVGLYPEDHKDMLLVLKDRPDWQKGKLNLPGGKIEDGETPLEAAVRELKEETGYDPLSTPVKMGEIRDSGATIHCFKILVDGNRYLAPRGEETELVEWHSIHTEIMQCASLIPNLRAIIPLMLCGIKDWVITDDYRSSTSGYHSLQLTLPTYCNAE